MHVLMHLNQQFFHCCVLMVGSKKKKWVKMDEKAQRKTKKNKEKQRKTKKKSKKSKKRKENKASRRTVHCSTKQNQISSLITPFHQSTIQYFHLVYVMSPHHSSLTARPSCPPVLRSPTINACLHHKTERSSRASPQEPILVNQFDHNQ